VRALIQSDMHAGAVPLEKGGDDVWEASGIEVRPVVRDGKLHVSIRCAGELSRVQLRWHGDLGAAERFLGDDWERSYGTLEWRGEAANRVMPWYCMIRGGNRTHGYGVETSPNAFCFWMADHQGVSLWIDVRNGGSPLRLRDRELDACTIVCREGREGESAFEATRALCRAMCQSPRGLSRPMVGTNDEYYAYGDSHPDDIASAAEFLVGLAGSAPVELVTVVDAGWSTHGIESGPWVGNSRFGDMGTFARRLSGIGVTPGIWFRPLSPDSAAESSARSKRNPQRLDPSIPEALELIAADIRRFREWGYRVIKHDFSCEDALGRHGFLMGASITDDHWQFNDSSRTSVEILKRFYQTIRDAAGDARVIGCNTFSHLSAGVFEMNRIGDDTSGRFWDRTRRMGVNTLAFRSAQNGTFYTTDPDPATFSRSVPWELSESWLRLVSLSGVPLFVSAAKDALGAREKAALVAAIASAGQAHSPAEPLDWLETQCPRRWKLDGHEQVFEWMPTEGAWPWTDTFGAE
jgi:alpha-galactosidase